MEKYIENISELNLGRIIDSGSCSSIHSFTPGILFKEFNEDYRSLEDPVNLEFLETIKTISSINYLPFVVRALDIYRSEDEVFGYTMEEVLAERLEHVSDNVLVSDFILGFEGLKPSIRILSDNYVKTEDIGGDNILYNGNMHLLDLDLSLVDKRYVPDELYQATRRSVFKGAFNWMTKRPFTEKITDDDYSGYIEKTLDICSNGVGYEIKTIGEFRDSYQKIYKKTTTER